MAELYYTEDVPQTVCWDRMYYDTYEDQLRVMKSSKTVYVGNLSFFTTEQQILEAFSVAGPVKRIIMGLNQFTKTPCGFCFVEYYTRDQAAACLKYVSGTILDDRIIRCDMDCGFKPGRQFGRGRSGGQVRDDRLGNADPARGGGGALKSARAAPGATLPQERMTGNKRGREVRIVNDEDETDAHGRERNRDRGNRRHSDPLGYALSSDRGAPAQNHGGEDGGMGGGDEMSGGNQNQGQDQQQDQGDAGQVQMEEADEDEERNAKRGRM